MIDPVKRCPRCKGILAQRLYGPCLKCREQMRENALHQSQFRTFLDRLWPGKMDPRDDD